MSIKIQNTNKELSANGGLLIFKNLIDRSSAGLNLQSILPQMQIAKTRNVQKFKGLVYGFMSGAECLDDMDALAQDHSFKTVQSRVFSSQTHGDFLREFSKPQIKDLNKGLAKLSYKLRSEHAPKKTVITFDIDSTSHKQYGKKMQGVAKNYNNIDCLDSIKVFDEFGFQYFSGVRPGNTHTAQGCGEIIHHVFSAMPKTRNFKNMRRYIRADSGYCNSEFFNACSAKNAGFVSVMRQNMFQPILKHIKKWKPIYPSQEIYFYDGRECEIGETEYFKDNVHERLRVVAIRAKKPLDKGMLITEDEYDYFSFITNIHAHEMTQTKLIKFYRKRGQAENFIKELKYGFDLKHFPCQKLDANRAYGVICGFAYTLMRFVSLQSSGAKPQYAKLLRRRLINVPVHIVRHGGSVVFKYCDHNYREVKNCLEKLLKIDFGFV